MSDCRRCRELELRLKATEARLDVSEKELNLNVEEVVRRGLQLKDLRSRLSDAETENERLRPQEVNRG